jgi:hypothetical protein
MNATLMFRIASILFVFFAAGHTFGFMRFKPPTTESLAVREAMNNVHFQVRGSDFSYGGFYTGFGLTITVYLIFFAFLSWHLGSIAREHPESIGALAWSLVAVQLASVVLSWIYFSIAPAALSALLAACLASAAWLAQSGNTSL